MTIDDMVAQQLQRKQKLSDEMKARIRAALERILSDETTVISATVNLRQPVQRSMMDDRGRWQTTYSTRETTLNLQITCIENPQPQRKLTNEPIDQA